MAINQAAGAGAAVQQSVQNLSKTTENIAANSLQTEPVDDPSNDVNGTEDTQNPNTESGRSGNALERDLVQLVADEAQVMANVKALKAGDENLQALVDIHA